MENSENMIEFISGQRTATVTFTNRAHITKIKKLYETRKEEFKYYHENPDGSICCKVPLKWVKINAGKDPSAPKREMTEEQKAKLAEGLRKAREKKSNILCEK